MRRLALLLPLSLAILTASPRGARAEAPSFTAQLSSTEVPLGESVQLTISLARDANDAYQGYLRPDFKDFDVLHQGQAESTQWTLQGGRQSVRTVEQHIYVLRPRKKGPVTVPPATARLGGKEFHTEALGLRVGPPVKRPPAPTSLPGAQPFSPWGGPLSLPSPGGLLGAPPDSMRGDEDIFIEARADKPSVYIGEPVTVSWYVYSQSEILRYRTTAEPKHDDFWSEDLYTPPGALSWDRAEVKGRPYHAALLLKRALYPLKSGKLTVTALEAEATTLQTAFYPTGSTVKGSRPIHVEALALPAAGRPEGFEPTNVGRYDIQAAVDRSQVKAGEAVTLKVTVRGEGNIRNLKLRKLDRVDGFRVYEPTLTERVDRGETVRGERTYTYLLLPERGGDLHLPPLQLAYFDPAEKRYFVVRSNPIPIHVEGDPRAAAGAPGRTEADAKENLLGPRLRTLRQVHHVSTRLGERILRGRLLALALAAPPGLLLALLVGGGVRSVLTRDTAGRRRRRARAGARRRMRAAEGHIRAQRPSAFFGECARALYEHLEYRLGEKVEALTLVELRGLLVRRGFLAELAERVVTELESSDFARFASSASGPAEMRAAMRRVRELLDELERVRVREEAA